VTDSDRRTTRIDALLFALFFVSGASALVYQTAWQRMLGLFSGSDTLSATIVVAAFLLGLGLGSLGSSGIADRLSDRHAILAFAACEVGIALFAGVSRFVFYDLVFAELVGLAAHRGLIFLIAFLSHLVPTFLMGFALPLLAKAIVRSMATASERIGALYGMNTLGAAIGAFAAGCFLIGTVGYEVAVYVAAALSLIVAAGALSIAHRFANQARRPMATHASTRANARLWRWCGLVFASGALIIAFEIVWFRVFSTMMQSTAYAFALVLGWFLIGDGLGLVLGARLVRRIADPARLFLWLQGAVAFYAVGALWLIAELHAESNLGAWFIGFDFFRTPTITLAHAAIVLATIAAAVVPPAALLGLSFPITQKAIQDDPGLVGQRVGRIQVFNILGNTLGSVTAGVVLLDWFGTIGTLRVLLMIGFAFTLAAVLAPRTGRARWPATAVLGLGLVALLASLPDGRTFWSLLHLAENNEGTLVGEDRTGVVVMRHGSRDTGLLFIGGHAQSNVPFNDVHGLLGFVGVLTHPAPRSVLVVGNGAGGTPYGAGANPASERIHVVEIVGPVFYVMRDYVALGGKTAVDALALDLRYSRVVGDARHVLFTEDVAYDVIEADAILPRSSHSGLLYSVEYFRQVRGRLKPGGVAVQWAPTERVVNGFLRTFGHVVELQVGFSTILLGSDGPIPFDRDALARRLMSPPVRDYVALAGWAPERMARQLAEARLRVWQPNDVRPSDDVDTDLFPKDEFFLNVRKIE
jgi:predicted membrane-bound spermidine synthase